MRLQLFRAAALSVGPGSVVEDQLEQLLEGSSPQFGIGTERNDVDPSRARRRCLT
jgi:hypothetical protein